jgi:arginine decarboxylase
MPGHKQTGQGTPRLRGHWGTAIFESDLAEMSGIDYLEAPTGTLLEAQALAAEAFGADFSFFLVNGSSSGNHVAMLSAVRPGQKVILPRASHRSVFAAALLAGAEPVYVAPEFHPATGLPLATSAAAMSRAIKRHPDAAAVHITSPSYYGFCSDVHHMVLAAREAGLSILADEAHGAHFGFHPSLPPTALQAGADLVVQSIHKTAGSLYQSSMLHGRIGRIRRDTVEGVLGLLQSSSPSALLLASLDEARSTLATQGRSLLERAIGLAEDARSRINEMAGLRCYGSELVGQAGVVDCDPTKLLVRVAGLGLTGYQAASRLLNSHSVEVEFADSQHILCSVTLADTAADLASLLEGLRALDASVPGVRREATSAPQWPAQPEIAVSLREASFAELRHVTLKDAVGEVCGESVMPYPPGIPVLLPGEVIGSDAVEFLRQSVADGANVIGAADPRLHTLGVLDQHRRMRAA